MRAVKFLSMLAIGLVGCGTAAHAAESSLQAFWSEFRQAVIHEDKQRVASLTRFPFEVRGPSDGDPVLRYDRAKFLGVYHRLMAQVIYVPEGSEIATKTMRDVVEEKPDIVPRDLLRADYARVHQFAFQEIDGHWLFVRAYLEE
jgi:hypothetical protein